MKCSSVDIFKCSSVCERQLNCGKHFCKEVCHDGPCEPCIEVIKQGKRSQPFNLKGHEKIFILEISIWSNISLQGTLILKNVCNKEFVFFPSLLSLTPFIFHIVKNFDTGNWKISYKYLHEHVHVQYWKSKSFNKWWCLIHPL